VSYPIPTTQPTDEELFGTVMYEDHNRMEPEEVEALPAAVRPQHAAA
jgi:hypothetical protein